MSNRTKLFLSLAAVMWMMFCIGLWVGFIRWATP